MVKIRSPLTPQGEEVKITARMEGEGGAHNTMIRPKPTICKTHYFEQKECSYPWVVVVVVYWM